MKRNVLPRPGSLSTVICPPISATSRAAIDSPSPVPSYLRVVELSPCSKAWKIFSCFSRGMPMPVSLIAKCNTGDGWSPGTDGAGSVDVCSTPASTRTTTSPLLGELDGVADEVEQDLPQPARVADQGVGHLRLDLAGQLQPLPVGAEGQRPEGLPQDVPQGEVGAVELELAGLDLGEVEQVVDHLQQGLRRGLDDRQVLALLARQRRVEGELGHAEDGVHGGADLVADVGQELILGPARRLRRVLGPPQRLLGTLLVVDVGDGPQPLDDLAGLVADRQAAGS